MTFFLPQRTMLRKPFFFSVALAVSVCPFTGFAETVNTEEWQIAADKVTRYDNPQSIVAEGNIVLKKIRKLPPQVEKEQKVTEWAALLGESPIVEEVSGDELATEAEPVEVTEVTIKADWVAYDVVMQSIKARGNIVIENDEDTLYADKADINLTAETGSFDDATIIRNEKDLHFEGKKIEKTGFNTYHIEDGWAITCKVENGETPPWSIASNDTTIEPGGYAVMKHAKFKIKNVPVFYTPYMIIPIKNTRQTGFLFPEFSNSGNNGFGFNFPFYIALSDSTDMTLYPQYFTNRGAMPGAEFRYVQSDTNKGSIMASYIDDKLTDPSETEYYEDTGFTHTNNDRYWVRAKADHTFDNNVIARADIDIVSDRDYLTEFNSGVTGFSQSNKKFLDTYGRGFDNKTEDERENSLKLLKSWTGMSLEANLLAINDVRREDQEYTVTTTRTSIDPDTGEEVTSTTTSGVGDLSDITTPVGTYVDEETGETVTVTTQKRSSSLWKLPSVDFTGSQPIGTSGLSFDWDADYVNYYRSEGIGGHRFDLHPRLSTPIPLGQYLESRAEVGVRDTYYAINSNGDAEWEEDDTQNRLLYDIYTEVETTLVRDFYNKENNENGFTHEVRPFISYAFIPDVDQDELPYFDSVDSIGAENGITYGIDNFFDLFGDSTRQYAYFKISQTYEFDPEVSDEPFEPISFKFGWKPQQMINFEYKTNYDVYESDFTTQSVEGSLYNSRGDEFTVDYSYNESANIEQINGYIKARLVANWLTEIGVEHSISEGETSEANVSLIYEALCWSLEFRTEYTPTDTSFMLMFNLANIGGNFGVTL